MYNNEYIMNYINNFIYVYFGIKTLTMKNPLYNILYILYTDID